MYRYPIYFKTEFHVTIYLNAMLVTMTKEEDGMGSSATNSKLQTPYGCYILPWPGTGSPATNAEIQNQYLLYVLLLELSLSLTSMKCFWLRTP